MLSLNLPFSEVEAAPEAIAKPEPLAPRLVPGLCEERERPRIVACAEGSLLHLIGEVPGTDVFGMRTGSSTEELTAMVKDRRPSLILIDFTMIGDGLELVRRLRSDVMTSCVPIIAIIEESSSAARVAYLTSGVDDLLAKPYDGSELVARIRSRLGRTREYLDTSPVTGLPGGTSILNEVRNRIREGKNYAVCHIDIDRFKSVSDRYGFERGAKFIQALGSALVALP
jgi:PleD family two-component response regulator